MAATTEQPFHYALPMLATSGTGVADAGASFTDSADTTLYFPETTDRSFKSVFAEIHVRHNEASAVNFAGAGLRLSFDGGGSWVTGFTRTVAITASGELETEVLIADVTAAFNSNFSGASDTVRWGFYLDSSGSGIWYAASCVLHGYYEFDASAHSTRLMSALIPIESTTTATTTSLAEIGSSQWPDLSTFCPEASKTFRQTALVLDCDFVSAGTTDTPVALAMDSEAETSFGQLEASQQSDGHVRYTWIRNDLSTSAAHAIKWRHTAGGALQRGGGYLIVNYEYDASSSTQVLVSIQPGWSDDTCNTLPTSSTPFVEAMDLWIEEPGTITMRQSGASAILQPYNTTITNFYFGIGDQSVRTYALGSANQVDHLTVYQRMDSGSAQGAALTLARGRNLIYVAGSHANLSRCSCWGGMVFLNYVADKPSQGVEAKNRTLWYCLDPALDGAISTDQNRTPWQPTALSLRNANYFLNNAVATIIMSLVQYSYHGNAIMVERVEGEGAGEGWKRIGSGVGMTPNERLNVVDPHDATWIWKRWAGDPRYDRLDIEATRYWRYTCTSPGLASLFSTATVHNITFTKSGTVSDYADADGAGLTVEWFWNNPDSGWEKCGESTTTAGGDFTFTWYDNTAEMFASVREDATHIGRSEKGTS